MNCQQTHNALTCQKNVAVYFKDFKTEEKISSQDQKSRNYQFMTTFFGKKTTTAQIRFCNDR